MRPLRYSINVTLDGCCDHTAVEADESLHRHHAENLERSDVMLMGRVTYQMMEEAFRPAEGELVDSSDPFAVTINALPKYVASRTLQQVDWNAQLLGPDLASAVRELKEQPGTGIALGGVQLPMALAELGLIDEYELVVHPRLVGRGPALFAGLSKPVDLNLVSRIELDSGAVALRYEPRR